MLREMAERLHQEVLANVSLTDHTLSDLNRMGNPYGFTNPAQIDEQDYLVHIQHATNTGPRGHKAGDDLVTAVKVRIVNQYRILVGIDDEIAPHFRDIFWGTHKAKDGSPLMRARDPITPAFETVRNELSRLGEDRFRDMIDRGDVGS